MARGDGEIKGAIARRSGGDVQYGAVRALQIDVHIRDARAAPLDGDELSTNPVFSAVGRKDRKGCLRWVYNTKERIASVHHTGIRGVGDPDCIVVAEELSYRNREIEATIARRSGRDAQHRAVGTLQIDVYIRDA